MVFCRAPFNALNLRSNGTIRTCCSSSGQSSGIKDQNKPILIEEDNSIFRAFNSQEQKNLRKAMIENNYNGYKDHCKHCIEQETMGMHSMRQFFDNMYKNEKINTNVNGEVFEKDLKSLDIRLDTICDQACVMCGPVNSSMWEKEISRNENEWYGMVLEEYHTMQKTKQNRASEDHIKKIIENADNLDFIEFRGGEPLVDRKVLNMIDFFIDKGISKNIKLSLVSNTQNFTKEIVSKLQLFRGGTIRCSIDSIGKKNEYHRYHSKWSKIEDGLKNLYPLANETINWNDDKNKIWKVVILPTLTVYNALQWDEYYTFFDDFFEKHNLRMMIALNSVKNRPELSPTVIKKNIREEHAKKLEKLSKNLKLLSFKNGLGKNNTLYFNNLLKSLRAPEDTNIEDILPKTVKWTDTIEKMRNQKLIDYYPETAKEIYK